jgi:hypothetical protein
MGKALPSSERFLNYYFKPALDTPSVFCIKKAVPIVNQDGFFNS